LISRLIKLQNIAILLRFEINYPTNIDINALPTNIDINALITKKFFRIYNNALNNH